MKSAAVSFISLFCGLLFSGASLVASSSFAGIGAPSHSSSSSSVHPSPPSLFGIPRGGGLFGGKAETDESALATPPAAGEEEGERQKYPAMSQKDVEEWLEHIPVYAVTDPDGAGVVLKPENDTSVFYFFLNPMQANATLQQLKGVNEDMDLKVSAFSLGKVWFGLINSGEEAADREVLLKDPGAEDGTGQATKGVQYRLVPDTRDLLGARMLLTMSPEDGEKMKEAGSMTAEMAQAAIKKAMTESPKFKATYNEIPVFTIAQMRMQKKPAEGEGDETITLLPMYFSLQNMVSTWQQFMTQAPPDVQGTEPAINLLSLHDLIEMMQKESDVDWRNVVLIPTAPDAGGGPAGPGGATVTGAQAPDAMAQMGGATLGDV